VRVYPAGQANIADWSGETHSQRDGDGMGCMTGMLVSCLLGTDLKHKASQRFVSIACLLGHADEDMVLDDDEADYVVDDDHDNYNRDYFDIDDGMMLAHTHTHTHTHIYNIFED